MKIPEIKEENGKIVLRTIIPQKEIDYSTFRLDDYRRNPIEDNQKILVECIEARMYSCYCKLSRNLSRIIGNNGLMIVYKNENGDTESFNMPSWKAMENVKKALTQNCFDHYSVEMTDQLLKSIVLGPIQKTCFKNYDKLIRYLLESLIVAKL